MTIFKPKNQKYISKRHNGHSNGQILNYQDENEDDEEETEKENDKKKFLFISEYGEILDLAIDLKEKGHTVKMLILNKDDKRIGDGIVDKIDDWHRYLEQDYIFVFDGCNNGDLQDWLREQGEVVFGGSKMGDDLENNRQLNQKWFKDAGFNQPESHNFTDIDEAIEFIEDNEDKKWILKQNGDAPKSINYKGKFEGNEDMLFHLEELKRGWNEQDFGEFDCDLMEVVEGMEVAASAFFNGEEFLKNEDGKVAGFLNFEEKKEADGNTGETCGEMGTTFISADEDNELFNEILLKPKIIEMLKKAKFRGIFDINGCKKEDRGYVAFEPTMRMGIPSTSYEFMEGLKNNAEIIEAVANGEDIPLEINEGTGMVICVAAKPFPLEIDAREEATSQGEKLWIMEGDGQIKDFTEEQKKHIHLYNFYKDDNGNYKVATKNGYLLVVSGKGENIKDVREKLLDYIKKNIYISGMKFRTDIGNRAEEYEDNY